VSDSYQPIYDAVRSRISGGNISEAVTEVLRSAGIGESASQCFHSIAQDYVYFHCCPSAVFKPKVFLDGSLWCALYGENIQEGVAGFGETPGKACGDFDKNWNWSQEQIRAAKPAPSTAPAAGEV
jgi:hypothetical protein